MRNLLTSVDSRISAAGLLVAIVSLSGHANSQTVEAPLFQDQTTLEIQIAGPLSKLTRERSDTEYLDGMLSYTDDSGAVQALDLRFRARGNYRRRKDTCWFPPIRLNVKKKQTGGTLFAGQNVMKIVTHCNKNNKRYEQFVIKEYLAYKILQLHTPYSFKVRLLKINWVDTDEDNKAVVRYGFIIEHKDQLAAEHDLEIYESSNTKHSILDRKQASIVSFFQYLIGNTDFSLVKGVKGESCCHNSILAANDEGQLIPIPYDFDFAGIVNAPYAAPNPKFRITKVTSRLFRGHCSVNPEFEETSALFEKNRAAVLDLITNQEGLEKNQRKYTLKFINKFYTELAKKERMRKQFARECF